MKNKLYIIYLLSIAVLVFVSCTPDKYETGSMPDKSELDFDLSLSSSNPNTVVYESNTPGYSVFWEWDNEIGAAGGYSTELKSSVHFGFPGKYTFNYTIMSKAGLVTADPKTIEVTTYDLDYMDHPLWINLTGGMKEEKVWYLDLDANGKSVYWAGPMYFYGVDDNWHSVTEGQKVDGDSWNWCPDWKGNQWIMPAKDYGSFTFGAIIGHTLVADKKVEKVTDNGTYMMDIDNYTMTFTKSTMLRDENRIPIVSNWSKVKLLSLTEDAMQLGVIRDNDPNEGPCLLVYNYVSKKYYDAHK